jgi:hypothetical protein
MKSLALISLTLLLLMSPLNAQVYNWAKLDSSKHLVRVYGGMDFGLIYGANYAYVVHLKKLTFIPYIDASLPAGKNVLDDSRLKIGSSLKIAHHKNWVLFSDISIINRQNENPFVRMQNVGIDPSLHLGYYKNKFFFALSAKYDYAFATYLQHSDAYKGNYSYAADGWYKNTAKNLSAGLNAGYSLKRIDISISGGLVRTNGLKNNPTLPIYGILGITYRMVKTK